MRSPPHEITETQHSVENSEMTAKWSETPSVTMPSLPVSKIPEQVRSVHEAAVANAIAAGLTADAVFTYQPYLYETPFQEVRPNIWNVSANYDNQHIAAYVHDTETGEWFLRFSYDGSDSLLKGGVDEAIEAAGMWFCDGVVDTLE